MKTNIYSYTKTGLCLFESDANVKIVKNANEISHLLYNGSEYTYKGEKCIKGVDYNEYFNGSQRIYIEY